MTMLQQSDIAPRVQGTYGYYRQPDGFITVSPATDTDELRYRRGGWEPLRRYGTFEMATPYMASHPLEPLFMAGGVYELTKEQIIQQGLHLNPILLPSCRTPLGPDHKRHVRACLANQKPVVFPQLAGMDADELRAFPCQMPGCSRPPFPTLAARDQHEGVMHRPEKSDERTGASLASALLTGFAVQPVAGTLVPAVTPTVTVTATANNDVVAPTPTVNAEMAAILAEMAAMREELAALKAAPAPAPAAPARRAPGRPRAVVTDAAGVRKNNRGQTMHTHAGPFGTRWLQPDCPRCAEMAAMTTTEAEADATDMAI